MSQLEVFEFEDNAVRSAVVDGEPWFVGKDVCRCLGIADHKQAMDRLDEDEVKGGGGYIVPPSPGQSVPTIISEPGVYRLVFTSRTEAAERFKRWLAHEVLPAIRRTGRYEAPTAPPAAPPSPMADFDFDELRKAAPILREWRLLYGKRAARRLAQSLPVPHVVVTEPDVPIDVNDDAAVFAADVLVRAQGGRMPAGEVYAAYVGWCQDNEARPMSQTMLGRRLADLGWPKSRSHGRIVYVDIATADND